jgi:hypothetical protein
MKTKTILNIAGVPVRYDGEGLDRHWITILIPGKETTLCLADCSMRTISRAIKNALARYSKHTAIA